MRAARFFAEALPLLSTYFSGESVELGADQVGVGEAESDEWAQFLQELRLRHVLAAAHDFLAIVTSIEANYSTVSQLKRAIVEDAIIGRLDIPRYVNSRATNLTWPRTYPVIVTDESAQTPENQLLLRLLQTFLSRLRTDAVPSGTAEWIAIKRTRERLAGFRRRLPWSSVHGQGSLRRLHVEAERRIARRQTGNGRAYRALTRFVDDWHFIEGFGAPANIEDPLVTSMMMFPSYAGFNDRIFEVWSLREIGQCLVSAGAVQIGAATSLSASKKKPIFRFSIYGAEVEVWFQRFLEPDPCTWSYAPDGNYLRGAPDISITWNGKQPLIFDAKNRLVTTQTRSEETYKLLGYLQNFPNTLADSWGAMSFVSTHDFRRTLVRGKNRLELLGANPDSASTCSFRVHLTAVLSAWFAHCAGLSPN